MSLSLGYCCVLQGAAPTAAVATWTGRPMAAAAVGVAYLPDLHSPGPGVPSATGSRTRRSGTTQVARPFLHQLSIDVVARRCCSKYLDFDLILTILPTLVI